MFPTGIDWSEKYLDFCITNLSGDVILRERVDNDNNDDGFNSMLSRFFQANINLVDIAVSIESPHQRVVDFLLAHGVSVYPVNPTAVHDYRKSRFPSGGESGCTTAFRSKSDTADAQLLADYLREHRGHLRVWRLPYGELR